MFSKCLHNFCCLQSCKIIQPYVESQTSPFLDACYLWGGNCNALHPRSQPPPRKRDEVTPGLTWVNDAHRWCPTTVSKRISLEQLRVRDRVDATQTSPPRSLKFCACVMLTHGDITQEYPDASLGYCPTLRKYIRPCCRRRYLRHTWRLNRSKSPLSGQPWNYQQQSGIPRIMQHTRFINTITIDVCAR